jgi:hypothetical protein
MHYNYEIIKAIYKCMRTTKLMTRPVTFEKYVRELHGNKMCLKRYQPFSVARNCLSFMKSKKSLPRSKQPATWAHPEP